MKKRAASSSQVAFEFDAEVAESGPSAPAVLAEMPAPPVTEPRRAAFIAAKDYATGEKLVSVDEPSPTILAENQGGGKDGLRLPYVVLPVDVECDYVDQPNHARIISPDSVAPTILQNNLGQAQILVDPSLAGTVAPDPSKPPYRIPLMAEIASFPKNGLRMVSTFSGCGGSCLGFKMAGYRVLWANEFVPAARDTYAANHPDTHLDARDIRTVTAESIRSIVGDDEIDVFEGSPPCFAAGTPVVTKRGVVAIESVVVGDQVMTHKLTWRRVTQTMQREAPTIVVDDRIETTADHLFYARVKSKKSWSMTDPEWVPASEVQSMLVSSPILFPASEPVAAPDGFIYDESFWYVVGRWIGDGWVRLKSGDANIIKASQRRELQAVSVPCLTCGSPSVHHSKPGYENVFTNYCSVQHRKKFERGRHKRPRAAAYICASFDEADDLFLRMSMLGVTVGRTKMRRTERLVIARRSLAEWLVGNFGRGARNKTLPGWAFGMRKEWRQALFDGYVDADGSDVSDTTVRTSSISRCLSSAVSILAGTLGLTTSTLVNRRVSDVICGRKVATHGPSYVVSSAVDDGRYTRTEEGLRWRRLRRETRQGSVATTVYDIEVEVDHSFVADGFVVHNCASFSTAGMSSAGWGTVKKYSDVKQRTDDLFGEYIRLLEALKPRAFVAENVAGMVKGVSKGHFKRYLAMFESLPYNVEARLLDAQYLGVPQQRVRLIFIGVRKDVGKPAWPKKLPYVYSVRDAIPWIATPGVRSSSRRVKAADDVGPDVGASLDDYAIGAEWDKLAVGETSSKFFNLVRTDPDLPCQTVTAIGAGSGSPGGVAAVTHPFERRKFTIAELRRICGFPDDFILTGPYSRQWERLGRAVPPPMMRAVATSLADVLLKVKP